MQVFAWTCFDDTFHVSQNILLFIFFNHLKRFEVLLARRWQARFSLETGEPFPLFSCDKRCCHVHSCEHFPEDRTSTSPNETLRGQTAVARGVHLRHRILPDCRRVVRPIYIPTGTTSGSSHSHQRLACQTLTGQTHECDAWYLILALICNFLRGGEGGGLQMFIVQVASILNCPLTPVAHFSIGWFIISWLIYRGSLPVLDDYLNLRSPSFLIGEWER